MSKPRVFISYGREDAEWAQALAAELSHRSVDVWYDTAEVQAGRDWQQALVRALRDSDVYALIVGSRSLSNPNVLFELGAATASERPVIPIILSSGSTPERLASFADIHQIRTDDVHVAADELKYAIEHLKRGA